MQCYLAVGTLAYRMRASQFSSNIQT